MIKELKQAINKVESLSEDQQREIAQLIEEMNGSKADTQNKLPPSEKGKRGLSLEDFSFKQTREKLKGYKISLSDAVIEERRKEL